MSSEGAKCEYHVIAMFRVDALIEEYGADYSSQYTNPQIMCSWSHAGYSLILDVDVTG
jgi:hypothetical protein